jgi:hypothetical protein
MKEYLKKYNPDYAFIHYIEHVRESDTKKADYYQKAYDDFKAGK